MSGARRSEELGRVPGAGGEGDVERRAVGARDRGVGLRGEKRREGLQRSRPPPRGGAASGRGASFAFGSAPFARRAFAVSAWPPSDARWRGVRPADVVRPTDAPFARSAVATSACPARAATWSGVSPAASGASTTAPIPTRRSLTASAQPPSAAKWRYPRPSSPAGGRLLRHEEERDVAAPFHERARRGRHAERVAREEIGPLRDEELRDVGPSAPGGPMDEVQAVVADRVRVGASREELLEPFRVARLDRRSGVERRPRFDLSLRRRAPAGRHRRGLDASSVPGAPEDEWPAAPARARPTRRTATRAGHALRLRAGRGPGRARGAAARRGGAGGGGGDERANGGTGAGRTGAGGGGGGGGPRRATARGESSNRPGTIPNLSSSPSRRSASWTRWPLTNVPLPLPSS